MIDPERLPLFAIRLCRRATAAMILLGAYQAVFRPALPS